MEDKKLLQKMISRIMKDEYPFIKDISVTEDMSYNVWFEIYDWEPFDDWEKFENTVTDIKNAIGLEGSIRFYYLDAKDEGASPRHGF